MKWGISSQDLTEAGGEGYWDIQSGHEHLVIVLLLGCFVVNTRPKTPYVLVVVFRPLAA